MPRYKRRTRLVSQDMKTGQFAYLDQLIKDGYYKNLLVLPENYDPPRIEGTVAYMPLRPLRNLAPENIISSIIITVGEQDIFNVSQKTIPTCFCRAGSITLGGS
jgi:hypothetical protein